jgi:predicted signal transduction protein with EAL and GGDEF domain
MLSVFVGDGLVCGVLVWRMLRPISEIALAMRRLAAKLADSPPLAAGELGGLRADVRTLTAHLTRLEGPKHPGGAWDRVLSELDARMRQPASAALLAVVRMGDFDRLAAFDRRAADLAVAGLGERLQAAIRKSAWSSQIERDGFAVWLPSNGVADPVGELRAISYVLGQDLRLSDRTITPDVRVGCASFPRDGADAATLLACAVAALPQTGGAATTPVNVFTPVAADAARRNFLIEQGLRQAIAEEQLFLMYQPVVDLRERRVTGAEALLRWTHPELGAVSPTEFIPILEQSGLIDEVGSWVLNAACREARAWRRGGLADLTMAVNVSARQFRSESLPLTVVRTLERNGLTPADLEVELTETAAMENSARTREILTQFQALGIGVAIDDFGAGFSSLSYLKNLPFSKLKIDREFVVDVHERKDSQAICSTLIALSRGLHIQLLAEGVERREEVEALMALGCTTFQGFFFARPQLSGDFVRTVTDRAWLDSLDFGAAATSEPLERRRA